MNNNDHKKQGKQLNPYIRFTSVAIQMGLTIYLGNLFGKWIDTKLNKTFLEDTFTLLSVFIAMYQVISQVIKVSKK